MRLSSSQAKRPSYGGRQARKYLTTTNFISTGFRKSAPEETKFGKLQWDKAIGRGRLLEESAIERLQCPSG